MLATLLGLDYYFTVSKHDIVFSLFFFFLSFKIMSSQNTVSIFLDILASCKRQRLFGVGFLFYGPSTHFRSFRARSVNLATLFLGKSPRQFIST